MENNIITLYEGDCLELMKHIPDKSIDAIITDPPYGTTACKWDSVIDFKLMWEQLNRIIKPNGAIVLFGSEPFSSALRMSNIKNYKYDWIWEKSHGSFATAKKQPLKRHEIISVFGNLKVIYYRQMELVVGKVRDRRIESFRSDFEEKNFISDTTGINSKKYALDYNPKNINPKSVLKFSSQRGLHPTQKPVLLMEYLIKTYTNENETVLDFTMGSGTTGVACVNTNRNFIGIEMDQNYFEIAEKRINESQLKIF